MADNDWIKPFRITDGRDFKLEDHDPANKLDWDKSSAADHLHRTLKQIWSLQDQLYAENRWAMLLIFQAMDAAGKDSTIEHVMSGINPQGCEVTSFKAPSTEELDHDFLWRTTCRLPRRGRIGIFNRSYYEEVLVARVHPEILARQRLPDSLVGKKLWEHRYEDITAMERHLTRNGTAVHKFFLHVSKGEQKQRFLDRLDEPEKNWKFEANDVAERQHWDEYQDAYETMIQQTASDDAPWYVVPADHKWFSRIVVADAVLQALQAIDPKYPVVAEENRRKLAAARKQLENE